MRPKPSVAKARDGVKLGQRRPWVEVIPHDEQEQVPVLKLDPFRLAKPEILQTGFEA